MKLKRVITIEYHWNVDNSDLKNGNGYNLDEIAEKAIFEARLQNISEGELTATIEDKTITGYWSFKYNFNKTGLKRL